MPLSDLKIQTAIQWTLTDTVTGWGSATQGQNAVTFKLGTVDFSAWDQAYAVSVTLAGGADRDIDLTALLNFLNESVTFTAILAVGFKCTSTVAAAPNGKLVVTPSAAFGFNAITDKVTVLPDGAVVVSAPTTSTGYTVDSTHKNLNVANTGTDSIVATVVVVGTTN